MKKFLSVLSVAFVCVFLAYLLTCVTEPLRISRFFPGDQKQQALIIGNGKYQKGPLMNPVNDAIDMAKVLNQQGFSVALETDMTRNEMKAAIRQFKTRLSAHKKVVGLLYFSGHGTQVDGKNYMLPINNAEIQFQEDVTLRAVQVDNVLAQMQTIHNGLNIIILDACRDNPYPSRQPGKGLSRTGLAQMTPPEGVIVAYATAPGKIASSYADKEGRNSLYTKHLLKAIQKGVGALRYLPRKMAFGSFKQILCHIFHKSN